MFGGFGEELLEVIEEIHGEIRIRIIGNLELDQK